MSVVSTHSPQGLTTLFFYRLSINYHEGKNQGETMKDKELQTRIDELYTFIEKIKPKIMSVRGWEDMRIEMLQTINELRRRSLYMDNIMLSPLEKYKDMSNLYDAASNEITELGHTIIVLQHIIEEQDDKLAGDSPLSAKGENNE